MYDLYEKECTEVSRSTVSEPKCHAITGIGYAGQYYTVADTSYLGAIWLHGTYEVSQGFLDSDGILVDRTAAYFEKQLQDYQWKVTTQRNLDVSPGQTIKFYPKYEAAEEAIIAEIEEDQDGNLSLELGLRSTDQADLWDETSGSEVGYSANYMLESHESLSDTSDEFYPADPTHFSAPSGTLNFEVPSNVKDSDLLPRITLDLSIELNTDKILEIGQCALELKKSSTYQRFGDYISWTPGKDIPEIDVTDWIKAPAEYTALYDGLSTGTLTLGTWPSGGSKLIIEVSEVSGHTDCTGSIRINSTSEIMTISGEDEYYSTDTLSALPTIETYDLDCHLKITATIANEIKMAVYMAEDFSETHVSYKSHPKLKANGTLNFWKRKAMT